MNQLSRSHNLTGKDEELLEIIKGCSYETLTKKSHTDGTPFLKHIFRLYPLIFGEVCTGCPSKIPGYISKLKNFNSKKMESTKSNFQLKKGTIIPVFGTSKSYSNQNLTDEVALEFLKGNLNRRKLFVKVPDNLDELLGGDVEKGNDEIIINEVSFDIEAARDLLDRIDVQTNAKTIFGINKVISKLTDEQKESLHQLVEGLKGE